MKIAETELQVQYRKYLSRKMSFIVLLIVLLSATAALSLNIGSSGMTVGESLKALAGRGIEKHARIVFDIRLPRIIGGFFVGMSIALSGMVIQSALNNPLASPVHAGHILGFGLRRERRADRLCPAGDADERIDNRRGFVFVGDAVHGSGAGRFQSEKIRQDDRVAGRRGVERPFRRHDDDRAVFR